MGSALSFVNGGSLGKCNKSDKPNLEVQIAEQVRHVCIQTAQEAFEDTSMNGVCREGALESAIKAMKSLDLDTVVKQLRKED